MDTAQIESYTYGGTLSLSGAGVTNDFHTLSQIDGLSISVTNGASLALPAVRAYANNYGREGNAWQGIFGADVTWRASGPGTVLDLPNVATLTGSIETWTDTNIQADAGGRVTLAGLTHIPGGAVSLLADGSGSIVDVSSLTSWTGSENLSTSAVEARNNGVVRFGGAPIPGVDTGAILGINGSLSIGGSVAIDGTGLANQGTLEVLSFSTIDVNGDTAVDGLGRLAGSASGTIKLNGNLFGNTQNGELFGPLGTVQFDGAGTAATPQFLEAMSADFGSDAKGFRRNFVYGTLALANNTYVKLTDEADNAAGSGGEAVYANSLVVPAGATLDLDGLHLYCRGAAIGGTIVGGSVTQIPDGGNISLDAPIPGAISLAGELDEWTFFGRSGSSLTVFVNPGTGGALPALPPALGFAEVRLVDASGAVLASGSSTAAEAVVTLSDIHLASDGNYRIQVRAPIGHLTNTGNYLVAVYNSTVDVTPLTLNQQATGRIDRPYNSDRWTFSAVAGQQIRFDLINAASPAITFGLNGPQGWTGFTNLSADSDLMTVPFAGQYELTVQGNGGNIGPYTFRMLQTASAALPLGTVYEGTLAGSAQAQLFRIEVPSGTPLRISLDSNSATGHNELYAKLGAPPTRSDYDARFSTPAAAGQELLVPMAAPGTWYILVYGDFVPVATSYTLVAQTAPVFLTGVTPDRLGNSADAELTLTGAGFERGMTVALVAADNTEYPAQHTEVDSLTQLRATFTADTVPPGRYTVRVTNLRGDSAQLPDAFEMTGAGAADLQTRLVLPDAFGRHVPATIYVEYSNAGTLSMPAPLLVLHATDKALLTLDASRRSQGFWTSAIPVGYGDTVQILASGETPGVLQPGESARVPVYYAGLLQPWDFSDTSIDFDLSILRADSTWPLDWSVFKEEVRPDSISPEAWTPIWNNFVAAAGTTGGSYVSALDENAAYLGHLGVPTTDVGALFAFELQQATGLHSVSSLASAVDVALDAPGFSLAFRRSFGVDIGERYQLGAFGRGWTYNWDLHVQQESDGTVKIVGPGQAVRVFQPDSRGGYFSQAGDYATLTALEGGAFSVRDSSGIVTRFRPDGSLDFVEDPNGNRVSAGYADGRLVSLTHSSGQAIHIAYNAAGRISQLSDHLGRITTYTYDASGEHLTSVTSTDGVTSYTYESGNGLAREHALASIAYPGGTHQFYAFEDQGRLSDAYRDNDAEHVTFTYDSAGKVSVADAAGGVASLYFDARGLLLKSVDPLGNATQRTFDTNYNLTRVVDPAGYSAAFSYDKRGNLIRWTDSLGHATLFSYTMDFDRLSSLVDANENVTGYTYDSKGNLISTTYADGSVERVTYDPLGDPLTLTNRRGTAISFERDTSGRLTRKTFSDGSHIDYAYDAHGNLVTATDAAGTTTLTYDEADRLTKIVYPQGRFLEFTYDAGSRRTRSVDQDGFTVNYAYDSAGRLAGLTDVSGDQIVTYTYDAAGRLTRTEKGNGTYTTQEYDLAGQLLHLVNSAPDGTVQSRFDYTYDSRGQRTSMGTLDGLWTYTYDATGQLIHAILESTNPAIPSQDLTYVYDALGNRIRTIENGVTTEYVTNNMNQYTMVGTAVYGYDADGNLIRRVDGTEVTTYAYDAENRLVSVTTPAGTWTHQYDAFGNRVATLHDGVRVEYLLDPIGLVNVVGEYDGAGALIARYAHGLGLVSRLQANGPTAYYAFDGTGSAAEVTGPDSQVENRYADVPFGIALLTEETTLNSFEYVGRLGVIRDEDGASYMRARLYLPDLGRFTSEDPIGPTDDVNLYTYAHNDPIDRSDASGLISTQNRTWRQLRNLSQRLSLNGDTRFDLGDKIEAFNFNLQLLEDWRARQNGDWALWYRDATGRWEYEYTDYNDWQRSRKYGWLDDSGKYHPPQLPPDPCLLPGQCEDRDRDDRDQRDSQDPNEKSAPGGFGPAGYVAADQALPYRIDFENDARATAPAQQVDITDQLSSNLDWATFELTEIGFGDYLITVPPHRQYHETAVDMTYNGESFQVQIEAGLRAGTGQVYARFLSIDPNTDLPPGVLAGFLPPENGTGRGQGYVSYVIQPKPGLPSGTEIRNVALITFDAGETIATNQIDPHDPTKGTDPTKEAVNTIDAGVPSSSVSALPATTSTADFTVTWSGQDDAGGSGVASYDVYVSLDDGEFERWLKGTPETSLAFTGQPGHRYGFYSVATDNVGHREVKSPTVEASTTVELPTTALLATDHPTGSVYGQSIVFTATVSAASPGVGVPSGTVQLVIDGVHFAQPVPLNDGTADISTAGLSAGSHSIVVSFVSDSGIFADSQGEPLAQTVALAPLTIQADDKTKPYGAALPPLTATCTGFVNGDTVASLTTPPAVSTTATATSPAGSYPIIATGAVAPNYTVTYVEGALTVVPSGWQNPDNRFDVTGEGDVTALDVLTVINRINAHLGNPSLPSPPALPPPFYDVNGDDSITAQDVLLVINYINSQPSAAAEAEAIAPSTAWDPACEASHLLALDSRDTIRPLEASLSRWTSERNALATVAADGRRTDSPEQQAVLAGQQGHERTPAATPKLRSRSGREAEDALPLVAIQSMSALELAIEEVTRDDLEGVLELIAIHIAEESWVS